jgi:hypothetical protein
MAALPDGAKFCTRCGLSLVEDRAKYRRQTSNFLKRRYKGEWLFLWIWIPFALVAFRGITPFATNFTHYRPPIYMAPPVQVIPAPPLRVDRNYFQPADPQWPQRTDNTDRRY